MIIEYVTSDEAYERIAILEGKFMISFGQHSNV